MDGPYSVKVSCHGAEALDATFVWGKESGDVAILKGQLEIPVALRNGVGIAKELIRIYKDRGWSDADSMMLESLVDSVEPILDAWPP